MTTRRDNDDIDLRHLRTFVEVVDRGGFGAAARELGLSQSAVSQTLALMEARLGGRLLDRARPPRPTPLGLRLLRHARAALTLFQAMDADLRQAASTLTLGLPPGLLSSAAPSWTAALRRRLPSARISLRTGTPEALRGLMTEGLLDGAVLPPGLSFPGEDATPLPPRTLVVTGPPALFGTPLRDIVLGHPLWADDEEDLAQAAADPVLGPLMALSPPCLASGAAVLLAGRSDGLALVHEDVPGDRALLHRIRDGRPLTLVTRGGDDRDLVVELRRLAAAAS